MIAAMIYALPFLWQGFLTTLAVSGLVVAGSLLLGLIFVMPMLGHASWHAYRDLVDASSLPLRDAAVATGQRSGVSS